MIKVGTQGISMDCAVADGCFDELPRGAMDVLGTMEFLSRAEHLKADSLKTDGCPPAVILEWPGEVLTLECTGGTFVDADSGKNLTRDEVRTRLESREAAVSPSITSPDSSSQGASVSPADRPRGAEASIFTWRSYHWFWGTIVMAALGFFGVLIGVGVAVRPDGGTAAVVLGLLIAGVAAILFIICFFLARGPIHFGVDDASDELWSRQGEVTFRCMKASRVGSVRIVSGSHHGSTWDADQGGVDSVDVVLMDRDGKTMGRFGPTFPTKSGARNFADAISRIVERN